jgi:hypothetical protein
MALDIVFRAPPSSLDVPLSDYLQASGIPSAEAFGTGLIQILGALFATGLPSAEAVGTGVIAEPNIYATGLPSAEAVGTGVIAEPNIYATGLPSEEVIGSGYLFVPAFNLVLLSGVMDATAQNAVDSSVDPLPIRSTDKKRSSGGSSAGMWSPPSGKGPIR